MQFRSGKSKGAKPHRPISNAAGTNRTCVAFKQFRRRHVRVTNASQGRKAWHEYEKCFHGLRCGPVRAYSHRFRRTHEHNKFEANRALANTDRAGSVSLLWRIWRLELGRGARGRGARLAVGWRPGGNGRLAVLRRGLRLSFLRLGVWESLLRRRLRLPLLRRRLRLSVVQLGVWEFLLRRRLRLPLLRLVFVLRQAVWLLRGVLCQLPALSLLRGLQPAKLSALRVSRAAKLSPIWLPAEPAVCVQGRHLYGTQRRGSPDATWTLPVTERLFPWNKRDPPPRIMLNPRPFRHRSTRRQICRAARHHCR